MLNLSRRAIFITLLELDAVVQLAAEWLQIVIPRLLESSRGTEARVMRLMFMEIRLAGIKVSLMQAHFQESTSLVKLEQDLVSMELDTLPFPQMTRLMAT